MHILLERMHIQIRQLVHIRYYDAPCEHTKRVKMRLGWLDEQVGVRIYWMEKEWVQHFHNAYFNRYSFMYKN